ncbi:MAG: carboxypeptidase-like regulatory domain-containing protein [Chitinophagales bacterium]|nr:carboxypeptidase-like regulatory domain-containing protein [Bacteroidota bacterium]MCB9256195.1 carboxypeptidase-like regulatory domain-containing protein [Chitinophagales bacterium]
MKKILGLFFLFSMAFGLKAQEASVIQFSGYVLTPDTLLGIPFVTIHINNTNRGTISNVDGFFSFAATEGDTINFSSIGFEDSYYVIPNNLQTNKYSIVKLMASDTYYIDTVTIYPWPSKEMFKQAFLALELEESDVDRALKNLEREYLKEMGEAMAMDATENANYYLRSEAKKYYYAGQAPPQNIFNLFAWAQFIEAWKRGDFKRKKSN